MLSDWTNLPEPEPEDEAIAAVLSGLEYAWSEDEEGLRFAIVRMRRRDICPVLGLPLAAAAGRRLRTARVVLVHQDDLGDWRTYGEPQLVFVALKQDFGYLRWNDLLASRPW